VLRAIGDTMWRATTLAALWAWGVTVQDQVPNQVNPLDHKPTYIHRVAWTEVFRLTRCDALFNNLFIKVRLQAGPCRRKAASAEPLLRTCCTPNDPHAAIRSVNTQLRFGAEALATRVAYYAEMWDRGARTRWLREKW